MSLPPISLAWPLTHPSLSSGFGPRWGVVHMGLDFRCPPGTPVLAPAAGRVFAAGMGDAGNNPNESYGLRVVLDHGGGWFTTLNHFTELALPGMTYTPALGLAGLCAYYRGLRVADPAWKDRNHGWRPTLAGGVVKQGDVLGLSGGIKGDPRSGLSEGGHVHLELRRERPLGRQFYDPMACLPGGRGPDTARSWVWSTTDFTVRPGATP